METIRMRNTAYNETPYRKKLMHIETAEQAFETHSNLLQAQALIANHRSEFPNDQAKQLELDRLQSEASAAQKLVYEIYMTKFAQN